ncbi:Transmembrane protein 19 [Smittium mucronatum]|uniref:Transmembrane protein 19 n=1 Tax=Smittium mucronatum TaxID=133383 RepID=A0A1R0GVE1_9FUNG|nr:Transmembrane protein 19 [Smittium mucronatum]
MQRSERVFMMTVLYMYTAFYSCCAGDTWASELGPLSSDWPKLVGTSIEVPPGTNGGITKLGMLASALGGATVGLSMDICYWYQYYPLIRDNALPRIPFHFLGAVFGFTGSMVRTASTLTTLIRTWERTTKFRTTPKIIKSRAIMWMETRT